MYLELSSEDWKRVKCFDEEAVRALKSMFQKQGVYVIWSVENSTIIYVGSSGDNIYERLYYHLTNNASPVKRFKDQNPNVTLKAAYVELNEPSTFKGVENYLGYVYQPNPIPKEIREYPNVIPYEVNLLPNEYFENPPVPQGLPYDINVDNWDDYKTAFHQWAVRIQRRKPDTYKKPRKYLDEES